jgi:V-type H+-transporting ATPase subunit A
MESIYLLIVKDSLDEPSKVTLEVAKIIKEDFLQQNGFSSYDKTCPFYKTIWMMRNIVTFYNAAQKAVQSTKDTKKIGWSTIKSELGDLIYKISCMKFQVWEIFESK